MLTADLLRVKDDGKAVTPRYIELEPANKRTTQLLNLARALIALFEEHIGRTRAALDDAIGDLVGDGTDHAISRGLTKLLLDRSTFRLATPLDPVWVRERVFQLADAHHPVVQVADMLHTVDRPAFLQLAARALQAELDAQAAERGEQALQVTPELIDAALYADLEEEQLLDHFDPIDAEGLIARYNLASAQAVLYRATTLNVRLHDSSPQAWRHLLRFMKFCRLMHTVRRRDKQTWELILDGPMSLFDSTQKYGLQMALFLPALLHCDNWELEAELAWGNPRQDRTFTLDPSCGLRAHYNAKGMYVTEEQTYLEDRFAELNSPWEVSRDAELIDLGGKDICVPDLVFRHRLDGRVALLEIIGFWRRGWLEAKAEHLRKHGPPNLILAVSDRLRADKSNKEPTLGGVHLYSFKGVILARRVLELVEAVAEVPRHARR